MRDGQTWRPCRPWLLSKMRAWHVSSSRTPCHLSSQRVGIHLQGVDPGDTRKISICGKCAKRRAAYLFPCGSRVNIKCILKEYDLLLVGDGGRCVQRATITVTCSYRHRNIKTATTRRNPRLARDREPKSLRNRNPLNRRRNRSWSGLA